jgi:predicted peptidase
MKKVLLFSLAFLCLAACKKQIVPLPDNPGPVEPPPPVDPPPNDTVAFTPFLQRVKIKFNPTHADSAILQLPARYNAASESQQRYPLLVFLNGVYEGSNHGTLRKMMRLGPPKYMADSMRFSFDAGGKTHHYIVVCPQSTHGFRLPITTDQIISYMIAKYRVDTTRIYLTGLSAGATSVFKYLTHKPEYAQRIAAAVPMSTTTLDSASRAQLRYINQANVPLLMYCGNQDGAYLKVNKAYAATINAVTPGLAEFRTYNGKHQNWNPMYSPTHQYYKPNMYEWLLQFKN